MCLRSRAAAAAAVSLLLAGSALATGQFNARAPAVPLAASLKAFAAVFQMASLEAQHAGCASDDCKAAVQSVLALGPKVEALSARGGDVSTAFNDLIDAERNLATKIEADTDATAWAYGRAEGLAYFAAARAIVPKIPALGGGMALLDDPNAPYEECTEGCYHALEAAGATCAAIAAIFPPGGAACFTAAIGGFTGCMFACQATFNAGSHGVVPPPRSPSYPPPIQDPPDPPHPAPKPAVIGGVVAGVNPALTAAAIKAAPGLVLRLGASEVSDAISVLRALQSGVN